MVSAIGKLALLGASLVLTGLVHGRMPAAPRADQGEPFVPRPELARATALGFDSVIADYYWLRAIQIVGGADTPHEHATVLGRLIDVVTTLDPWVDHPYRFAAVWLTGSQEQVRAANRLLERGIAHHPDEWRNRFYLGFNHFFYLEDAARAADVLQTAAVLPGAPSYLGRLVARLRAEGSGLETAAAFLEELARTAPDEYARAEYEKALEEIQTERWARVLDRARERYREGSGRDIETVEDLVRGPAPVLPALPREPHDWEWVIDPGSGRIVSSYYGHRYERSRAPDLPAASGSRSGGKG